MKILLINYRYYEAAGPERYLFNVKQLLESHDHEVIIFSSNYKKNTPSKYQLYFADPPGGDDESFYYKDLKLNSKSIASLLGRQFYSRHVYDRLVKLIQDTKPDIAYVLHFVRKLSPSIIDACYDLRVPVIVRLSDFVLICPKHSFYRNGAVCELCQKNVWNSVKYNCVKDSKAASLVNYFAFQFNYLRGFQHKIAEIISPSLFAISRFKKNKHYHNTRFNHIPTFVNPALFEIGKKRRKSKSSNTIIYWGRISHEKGIDSLLFAMERLKAEYCSVKLLIIGSGEREYIDHLRSFIASHGLTDVEYIPFLEKEKLYEIIQTGDVAVVPSVCYDNMPNSAIEAQALGLPLIASDVECLPEIVQDGFNGYLHTGGDSVSLANAIKKFFANDRLQIAMSENSYRWAVDHYSAELHYQRLIETFQHHL